MWNWICSIVCSVVLAYGGVVDRKRREIPDIVPIVILVCGLFEPYLILRLVCMIGMLIVLMLAHAITKQELPGGDLKLILAMTFLLGISSVLLILIIVGIEIAAASLIGRRYDRNSIPLCTYIAPAFILLSAANLILGGY